MSERRDTDSQGDGRSLEELAVDHDPSADVEARLIARLVQERLIQRDATGPGWRPGWWSLAASVLLSLAVGWTARGFADDAAGVPPETTPTSAVSIARDRPGSAFLLLLSEPSPLRTEQSRDQLAVEYRGWAEGLESERRLLGAARLASGASVVDPRTDAEREEEDVAASAAPTGFFLITAASLDEAVRVAGSSPHVGYGGVVTVRPVLGSAR